MIFISVWQSAAPAQVLEGGKAPWIREIGPAHLNLPDWGNVEAFLPGPWSDETSRVLLIEDAHTSLEAQDNIYNILGYLKREHLLDEVWIEGAAGPLDTKAVRAHGISRTPEAMRGLVQKGLLTGAARFWLENSRIKGHGLESPKLYHNHLTSFRKVTSRRTDSLKLFDRLEVLLRNQAARYLSTDALDFLRLSGEHRDPDFDFNAYTRELLELSQRYLKMDWNDYRLQGAWPQLIRLHRLGDELEDETLQRAEAQAETVQHLLSGSTRQQTQQVKLFLSSRMAPEGQAASAGFSWRSWVESSAYQLRKKGQGFERYPDLYQAAARRVFLEEIDARALNSETQKLETQLWKKLAPGREASDTLRRYQALARLREAFLLRLSPDEAVRFAAEGHQDWKELSVLLTEVPLKKRQQMAHRIDEVNKFYTLAFQRDTLFYSRILNRRDKAPKNIVMIAGGFHRQGLEQKLTAQHVPYWVIRPRMNTKFQEDLYQKRMTGDYNASHLALAQVLPMRNQKTAVTMLGSPGDYRRYWAAAAGTQREKPEAQHRSEVRAPMARGVLFKLGIYTAFMLGGIMGSSAIVAQEKVTPPVAPVVDILSAEQTMTINVGDMRRLLWEHDLELKTQYVSALIERTRGGIIKNGVLVKVDYSVGKDSQGRPTFDLNYQRLNSPVKTAIGSLSSMNPFKFLGETLVDVWASEIGRPSAQQLADSVTQVEARKFEAFFDRKMNKVYGELTELQMLHIQRSALFEVRGELVKALRDAEDKQSIRQLTLPEVNQVRRKVEVLDREIRENEKRLRQESIKLKQFVGLPTSGPDAEKIVVTDADIDFTPQGFGKTLTRDVSQRLATDERGPYHLPRNREYSAAVGTIGTATIANQHMRRDRIAEFRLFGLMPFHHYDPYSGRGTGFGAENKAAELTIDQTRIAAADIRRVVHADIADLYIQIEAADRDIKKLKEAVLASREEFEKRQNEPDYTADELVDYAQFIKEDELEIARQKAIRMKALYALYFVGGYKDFYWFGRGVDFSVKARSAEELPQTEGDTRAVTRLDERQQKVDTWIVDFNRRLTAYNESRRYTRAQTEAFHIEKSQIIAEEQAIKLARQAQQPAPALPQTQTQPQGNRDDLNRRWQAYQSRRDRLNQSILNSRGRAISQEQFEREKQEAQELDSIYRGLLEAEGQLRSSGSTRPAATWPETQTPAAPRPSYNNGPVYGQPQRSYPQYGSPQGFVPTPLTPLDFIGTLFGASPAQPPMYTNPGNGSMSRPQMSPRGGTFGPRSELRTLSWTRRQWMAVAAASLTALPQVVSVPALAQNLSIEKPADTASVQGRAAPLPLKEAVDLEAESGWVLRSQSKGAVRLRVEPGFYKAGTVLAQVRDAKLEAQIKEAEENFKTARKAFEEAKQSRAASRDRTVMLPLEAEVVRSETELNRLLREHETWTEYQAPVDLLILKPLLPDSGSAAAGTALFEYLPADRIRFSAAIPMSWIDLQSLDVLINGRPASILAASVKAPDLKKRQWEVTLDVRPEMSLEDPRNSIVYSLSYREPQLAAGEVPPVSWKIMTRVAERVRVPVTGAVRSGRAEFTAAENARVRQGSVIGGTLDAKNYYSGEHSRLHRWSAQAADFLKNPGTKANQILVTSMQTQVSAEDPFDVPPKDFEITAPADGIFLGGDRLRNQPAAGGRLDAAILTHQVLIGRRNRQETSATPVLLPRNYPIREGQIVQVILPTGERLSGSVTVVLDQVRESGRDLSDYQEIVVLAEDPNFILHPGMPVTISPVVPAFAGQLPLLSPSRSQPQTASRKVFPVVYHSSGGSSAVEEALRNAAAQAGPALAASLLSESDPEERLRLFEALEKQFSRSEKYTELLKQIAAEASADAASEALEILSREEEAAVLIELHNQFTRSGDALRRQMVFELLLGLLENRASAERVLRKSLQNASFHEAVLGFLTKHLFLEPGRSPLAVAFFLESGFLEQTPFLSDERLLALSISFGGDPSTEKIRNLLQQEYERRLAVREVSAHSFRASAEIIKSRTTPSIEKLAKLYEVQHNLLLALNHYMLSPENRTEVWPRLPEALRVPGRDIEKTASEAIQPLTAKAVPGVPGFFDILTIDQQIEKIRLWKHEQRYRSLAAVLLHPSHGRTFESDLIKAFLETREGRLQYARLILEFPEKMELRSKAVFSGRTFPEWLMEDFTTLIQKEPFRRGLSFEADHVFPALAGAYQNLDFYERSAARRIYQQALLSFYLKESLPEAGTKAARILASAVIDDTDLTAFAEILKNAPEVKRTELLRAVSLEQRARAALFGAEALRQILPRQSVINYVAGREDIALQTMGQNLMPPYSAETLSRLEQTDSFSALWYAAGAPKDNQVVFEAGIGMTTVRYENVRQGARPWITDPDVFTALVKNRQTQLVFTAVGVFGGFVGLSILIGAGFLFFRWMSEWRRGLRISHLPAHPDGLQSQNWNTSLPPAVQSPENPNGASSRSEVRAVHVRKALRRLDRLARSLENVHFWILRLFPEDDQRHVPAGLSMPKWEPKELKTLILKRLKVFRDVIAEVEKLYGVVYKKDSVLAKWVPDESRQDFEFLSAVADEWSSQSERAMDLIEAIMKSTRENLSVIHQNRLAGYYELFLEHKDLASTLERSASSMDSLQQDQGFYPASNLIMEWFHKMVRILFWVKRSVQRNQDALLGGQRSLSGDFQAGLAVSSFLTFLLFLSYSLAEVTIAFGLEWLSISAGLMALYAFVEMLGFSKKSNSLVDRWVLVGSRAAPGSYSPGKVNAIKNMIRGLHRARIDKPSRFIKKSLYFSRRATTRWSLLTTVAALMYYAFLPLMFPIPFYETDWITQAGAAAIPILMFAFHITPTLLGGADPLGYWARRRNINHRRAQLHQFYRKIGSRSGISPRARQLESLLKETLLPIVQPETRTQPFDEVVFVVDETNASSLEKLDMFIQQMRQLWPQAHFQIQKQENPAKGGRAWGLLEARRTLYRTRPQAAGNDKRRVFIMAQGSIANLLRPLPLQLLNGEPLDRLHLLLISVLNAYQAARLLADENTGGDIILNGDVLHLGEFGISGDATLQLANASLRQVEISRPGIAYAPLDGNRRIAQLFQHPDGHTLRTLIVENPGLNAVSDMLNLEEPRFPVFTGTIIFRSLFQSSSAVSGSYFLEVFDKAVAEAEKEQVIQDPMDLDIVFDLLIMLIRFYGEIKARRAKIEYNLQRLSQTGPINAGAVTDILDVLLDPYIGFDSFLAERVNYTIAYKERNPARIREQRAFLEKVYKQLSRFLQESYPISILDFFQLPVNAVSESLPFPRRANLSARFEDLPFMVGQLPSHFSSAFGKLDTPLRMRSFFSDPLFFPPELVNAGALQNLARSEIRKAPAAELPLQTLKRAAPLNSPAVLPPPPRGIIVEGALAAQKIARPKLSPEDMRKVLEDIHRRAVSPRAGLNRAAVRYGLTGPQIGALERRLKNGALAADLVPLVFIEADRYAPEPLLNLIETRGELAFVFKDAADARAFVQRSQKEIKQTEHAYYVIYAPQGQSVFINTLFQPGNKKRETFKVFHSASARPLEERILSSAASSAGDPAQILSVTRTAGEARKIQRLYVPYRFAFGAGAAELDEETRLLALRLLLQAPDDLALRSQAMGVILIDQVLGQWLAALADQQVSYEQLHAAA